MNSRKIPVEWLPQYTYEDYEKWEGDWELIYGIPYALSPSPKRVHQATGRRIMRLMEDALLQNKDCGCEVYYELDWIIDESTVVRPDVMIVCGKFDNDFLRFPPSLIVEITSKRIQMADRNVKFKLYESQQVPYYLIADPERKSTEIFSFVDKSYRRTEMSTLTVHENCCIALDLEKLWV